MNIKEQFLPVSEKYAEYGGFFANRNSAYPSTLWVISKRYYVAYMECIFIIKCIDIKNPPTNFMFLRTFIVITGLEAFAIAFLFVWT